jgi:hypothetical protein
MNNNQSKPNNPYRRRVRDLNDKLRTLGVGGHIVMTDGIAAEPSDMIDRILNAVRRYDVFNEDNDPWGERDFGRMKVGGLPVIWKIDYYDRSGVIHSPDPADARVTVRVLTIMRADEY